METKTGTETRTKPLFSTSPFFRKNEPRRTKDRIILDALLVIQRHGEAIKTHVMYGANLSFDQWRKLLNRLKELELVTVRQEGRKTYLQVTSKGGKAIKSGKEFLKLTGEI